MRCSASSRRKLRTANGSRSPWMDSLSSHLLMRRKSMKVDLAEFAASAEIVAEERLAPDRRPECTACSLLR